MPATEMPGQPHNLTGLAAASIAFAVLVVGLKGLAWHLSGSVALLSDALESLVNVVSAAATLWAVHLSQQPADAEHPYGHHKAEYLSAVAVGVLIVLSALLIFHQSFLSFLNPKPLASTLGLAVAANVAASIINAGWAVWLLRCGRLWRSPALLADGEHLRADVITSLAVLAGLALVPLTGLLQLDAILAACVALHILYAGSAVIRDSINGLMDRAVPEETATLIRRILKTHADGALEIHDLKTRLASRATFIEFHLIVPGDLTVQDAHSLCDRIEDALQAAIPGAHVLIHTEPEHEAHHLGVVVL